MKLLVLIPKAYDTSPPQRFRIEQWERWMRTRGLEVDWDVYDPPALARILYKPGRRLQKAWLTSTALLRRLWRMRRARNYDAVYICRETSLLGPALVERWLHWVGVPYVYDFDDSIFVPDPNSLNRRWQFLKCFGKTATSCRLAAHVTVANEFLAEYARPHNPNVTVIPTTIDTDKYQPRDRRAAEVLVVGWSGSITTLPYLLQLAPVLQAVARRRRYRLLVIGATGVHIDGVDVTSIAWRSSTEVDDLAQIDIGLYPLPDTVWTRGKGGLKLCQYMAMGLPAVAARVRQNEVIVQDGRNGLLAGTEREWIDAIERLLDDPDLRRRLGAAGRETVVAGYSLHAQAPRVYDILRAVARPGMHRARRQPEPSSLMARE